MLSLDEQLHKILSHYIGNYVTADEYESDVKEAGQAIQVLIAQQVKEARLEELQYLLDCDDQIYFFRTKRLFKQVIKYRIEALKGDK